MGLPIQLLLNPAPNVPGVSKSRDLRGTRQQSLVGAQPSTISRPSRAAQSTIRKRTSSTSSATAASTLATTSSANRSAANRCITPDRWLPSSPTAAAWAREVKARGLNPRGTVSFSVNAGSSGPRRRGPLSAEQRKRTALMRKMGACLSCRRKKVSCQPSHQPGPSVSPDCKQGLVDGEQTG
ncbi:hypothetical protein VTK56DRAFT_4142 [Thermocarpiscus australiensis]